MTRSGERDDDADASAAPSEEERLRRRFERLHLDLLRRDAEAHRDPLALQRWPRERKTYADRVDTARLEWELQRQRGASRDDASVDRDTGEDR